MERNLDKIKRLEHELGRYQRKVSDQHREISRLNQMVNELRGGLRELNKASDALCIAVAVKYGAEVGTGAMEATLPEIRVDDLLRGYALSVNAKGGQYIIRAEKRPEGGTDDPA